MGGLPLILPALYVAGPVSSIPVSFRNVQSEGSGAVNEESFYHDVMLDIETMDTATSAVVVSIGAYKFRLDGTDDHETLRDDTRSFYAVLDRTDQKRRGRTTDFETEHWWSQQSDEAKSVLSEVGEDVREVLLVFRAFCQGVRRIWGNGNTFDNAIVKSLCKSYEVEYPVHYTGDLDVRTLTYLWNLFKKNAKRSKRPKFNVGEVHNALDDAKSQVLSVQAMYRDIKGSKYDGT